MNAVDVLKNIVMSPDKEMLAYETLWALENNNKKFIKEKDLKELFKNCTPSEALKQIPTQSSFFKKQELCNQVEEDVKEFFKSKLKGQQNTFFVVVNKGFQYPTSLKRDCPIGLLYCKGNLDIISTPCISIVGARKASNEGLRNAEIITEELVRNKYTIVSGLALGIDKVAHEVAIKNKGITIGVLGTPIDEYYPQENKALQDKIARDHLLISQVSFYKYANEPFDHRRFHFPRRNLTMASISSATVIVEASDTSGTHIQAKECLKQGKKLFIMNSCFNNPKIKWPIKYTEKGAIKVKDVSDILKQLKV